MTENEVMMDQRHFQYNNCEIFNFVDIRCCAS